MSKRNEYNNTSVVGIDYEAEWESRGKLVEALRAEDDKNKKRISELEKQLAEAEKVKKEAEDKYASLDKKAGDVLANAKDLKSKFEDIEAENKELKASMAQLEKNNLETANMELMLQQVDEVFEKETRNYRKAVNTSVRQIISQTAAEVSNARAAREADKEKQARIEALEKLLAAEKAK